MRNWIWLLFSITAPVWGEPIYDVVIYGGSSAGVVAAVQAARMGKSAVLIEPGKHLGGMTSSGLGWVDIGNPASIGGIAHQYFHRVWNYYNQEKAWVWEPKNLHLPNQFDPLPSYSIHIDQRVMWVLEPHVAEHLFEEFIQEAHVPVIREERLDRNAGVLKEDARIVQITMESGRSFQGRMFIDATYEGDLMAAAGVSYIVGRESNSRYGETMNGIQANTRRGNIPKRLDPYVVKGDPTSGLLPRIYETIGGVDGEGDNGLPAYNYRMCLTDVPENRIPIEKPEDYEEQEFEIVFRAMKAGVSKKSFFKLDLIPNRKTDSNNNGPVSTDYVGMSWDYPEADYETRETIARNHETWQRGLIWTLQNHPDTPQKLKDYFASWGLPKDEFADNNHWPYQLYVREARRMIGEEVITEHTVLKKTIASDGIGLGSYHLDSHVIKFFVAADGFVMTDGTLFKKGAGPFPISYRTIIPTREECENLLVPICLSASHVGYSAVRMEPVFMVLGQSAATAASLAIDQDVPLQQLPYESLRLRLLADLQILK